jgi:hypothetical protein
MMSTPSYEKLRPSVESKQAPPIPIKKVSADRLTGAENPGRVRMPCGILLDDPGWFKPALERFICDAQPWDIMSWNAAVSRNELRPQEICARSTAGPLQSSCQPPLVLIIRMT